MIHLQTYGKQTASWHELVDVAAMREAGFTALVGAPSGNTHRWVRGDATIDILVPRGLKEGRSDGRRPSGGWVTTVTSAGAQFLLKRSSPVEVEVAGRTGVIQVPDLLGAIYGKCSALLNVGDSKPDRHLQDTLLLASVVGLNEFRALHSLTENEINRLRGGLALALRENSYWEETHEVVVRAKEFSTAVGTFADWRTAQAKGEYYDGVISVHLGINTGSARPLR